MAITKLNSLAIPPDTVVESDISFPLDSASFTGDLTVDTDTLVVDSTNNRVGIGTSDPSQLLHVAGSGNIAIKLDSTSTGGDAWRIFSNADGSSQGAGSMAFYNEDTATYALNLQSNGNVGIGDSAPSAKLEVNGGAADYTSSATGTGLFHVSGGASSEYAFYVGVADQGVQLGHNGGGSRFLSFETNETERMRIDSSGNLLVGQTSASISTNGLAIESDGRIITTTTNEIPLVLNKLNTGTQNMIHFYVNTVNAGYIRSTGGGTPAFGSASDIRLKESVTDHESELANVMALRPVRWDWIDSERGSGEGFVAQELEQTAWADLVSEGEDGYKQVAGLGAVETRLIKAIQEQQAMIETLQAQVAELQGAN